MACSIKNLGALLLTTGCLTMGCSGPTLSPATTSAGAGGGGAGGAGAGGDAQCAEARVPIEPKPYDRDVNPGTLVPVNPLLIARFPGWVHPMEIHAVTLFLAGDDVSGCSLAGENAIQIATGGAEPPTLSEAWTRVTFTASGDPPAPNALAAVTVDIPPTRVEAGASLFVMLETKGPAGKLCPGVVTPTSGFVWFGADTSNIVETKYQLRASLKGDVIRCDQALFSNAACEVTDQIGPAPTEDGDIALERLFFETPGVVDEITLRPTEAGDCLAHDVELVFAVADGAEPPQSFSEVTIPKDQAYRLANDDLIVSFKPPEPLSVAATQALYVGMRQRTSPMLSCVATCEGATVKPGMSWWGDAHSMPGTIGWSTLWSSGFQRSLRAEAWLKK